MELTSQETEKILTARLAEYPQLQAVANDARMDATLSQILDYHQLATDLLPVLKNEILVILALFAPLRELSQNIQESTGLSAEISEGITTLIETLILEPVFNDLKAYEYLWEEQSQKEASVPKADGDTREKLVLRPDGVSPSFSNSDGSAKPLTREEVLRSLAPRRTMAGDIASMNPKEPHAVEGYAAYQNKEKK